MGLDTAHTTAPGSRILVRDDECLVRRADRTLPGAAVLTLAGLSPLVRSREAKFIDSIEAMEEPVRAVDPKAMVPPQDSSPCFRDTRTFLQALFRRTVPPDERLIFGHRGTDVAQPSALMDLDVLAACVFGLTLAELQSMSRIQFPLMRRHEADTLYDQCGRIFFTNSKGLPAVGLRRAEWNEVKALQTGAVPRTALDTTVPTGPVERQIIYLAPITKSDRETDYATVWGTAE